MIYLFSFYKLSIKLKVVSRQYLVFSQNSKAKSAATEYVISIHCILSNTKYLTHVGDRVCDCHDMFSTCLAMTKSKRNMHKEIVNTRNFSPLCHCEEPPFLSLRGAKRRGNHIHLYPQYLLLYFN